MWETVKEISKERRIYKKDLKTRVRFEMCGGNGVSVRGCCMGGMRLCNVPL